MRCIFNNSLLTGNLLHKRSLFTILILKIGACKPRLAIANILWGLLQLLFLLAVTITTHSYEFYYFVYYENIYTVCYQSFKPLWICDTEGTLTLINNATGDRYIYQVNASPTILF